jgi:hypothetical protein
MGMQALSAIMVRNTISRPWFSKSGISQFWKKLMGEDSIRPRLKTR